MKMENDKAPSFEMPNEAAQMAHAKPYYGNQYVPKPNNREAMNANPEAIVRSFTQGK